jgi:hypothetical protein
MVLSPNIRFDPAIPLFWRKNGNFVIGFPDIPESNAIEIRTHTKQVATWIALIDGTRSLTALIESGTALGIPAATLTYLLDHFQAASHTFEVRTLSSEETVRHQLSDIRYQSGLLRTDITNLLSERISTGIEVVGAGVLPARVITELSSMGFQINWTPNSKNRIRLEDAELGGLPLRKVGQRWNELTEVSQPPALQLIFMDSFDPNLVNPNLTCVPIIWHQRRVAIGPMLQIAGCHSAQCLHHIRLEQDPEWSFTLTQLIHNQRPTPIIGRPWLELATSQITSLILQLSKSECPIELTDSALELIPPNSLWRLRSWQASKCNCARAVA